MSRGDQVAFPADCRESRSFAGLSVREYFAAKAMQAWVHEYAPMPETYRVIAAASVGLANALLAELDCTDADKFTSLSLVAAKALDVLEQELHERKTSGNDEEFAELEQLVTNLREALS